ncbi:Mitochondrial distribution and morphology protein 34 [Taphrina deformans PYCC 5710]|uniref:Mitochondrial distribution and morphology protein 34 n=1 Tax=Taphrina deformans (strain PYCC 5710 / ATCC 11124 / CBS 356.35 / IMI 108563 / JCM 9778 / NBRC 8474) TaxID=1097556 RepID=R4XGC2_TAPDE|nr:Mitochondrial distribution and morphology protein 34 [Taphrina deformans PYCC 5710]|eukprot:CCG82429.1 Mitochondrial distribution and morphology protein 34 [Taphrina deformans PYCC 5710]
MPSQLPGGTIQDLPPQGGFAPIQYKRNLPARGLRPSYYLLAMGALCTYGFYKLALGMEEKRDLQRERVWSRIYLTPMLQAEADRDTYRRRLAAQSREAEIMKDVKGWDAKGSVYHGRHVEPIAYRPYFDLSMAFNFSWNDFSAGFVRQSQDLLTAALNKGAKPSIIADDITVKELNMGSQPPELELIELGDLAIDEFRGVFRLKYSGDAHLVLQTKVQANPLLNRPTTELPFAPVQMVAADAPLTVPMFLQLSDMKVNGVVILLFTKSKGLSMVFRNDPLDHVLVTSTFDSIPAIRDFLQCQIEKKLRQLFCDELPAIIQTLSFAWTGAKRSPKVRATTLDFAVPAMESRSLGGTGYNTPKSIPHLYRNQSFTGRGQLTPFTPAIAQAIYKSTSLSALDLAERRAKSLSSTSPRVSPKKSHKRHSIIRLNVHETPTEKETVESDTRETTSYFAKDAPVSPAAPMKKNKHITLTPIAEKSEKSPRTPNMTEQQKVRLMQQLLHKKLNEDRRSSGAGLEDDITKLVI